MSETRIPEDYLNLPLGRFLELTAARSPAPGGGSAAAVCVALAASLVAMAARFSDGWLPDAQKLVARAEGLRGEVEPLIQADATVYARVLEAGRADNPRESASKALSDAAEAPLAVAEAAATLVGLAARLARSGNPNLRGDAVTAGLLAGTGLTAAAGLVEMNLVAAGLEDDGRRERAAQLARAASSTNGNGGEGRTDRDESRQAM